MDRPDGSREPKLGERIYYSLRCSTGMQKKAEVTGK